MKLEIIQLTLITPNSATDSSNSRPAPNSQYENNTDSTSLERNLMYRDGLEALKSEPEPILN